MKTTRFTFLLLLACCYNPGLSFAKVSPSDSLKTLFNNPVLSDTTRARAIIGYIDRNEQIPLKEKIALLDTAMNMISKYDNERLGIVIIRDKVDAYRHGGDAERINIFKSATDYLFIPSNIKIP